MSRRMSCREFAPIAKGIEAAEKKRSEKWLAGRLALLPSHWANLVRREHKRRGGLTVPDANRYVLAVTASAAGRLSLAASDEDLKKAAKEAAADASSIGGVVCAVGAVKARALLGGHCERWGVLPPAGGDDMPAIRRMLCPRWWLRRLRRSHGRRCETAAIKAGVVKRGLWPYASQDAVEMRLAQRRRNARSIEAAYVVCDASGESLSLAEVVAGSIANPEVKRAELMVRVKGCDAIASQNGDACEFWTLTAPSEYHAMKMVGTLAVPNKAFDGKTPKDGQKYLSTVWARARAAWKRRGLAVFGLRTVEPHHDGCPHWHLIAYGPAEELRLARYLLKRYALREKGWEDGAREHRFKWLTAKAGTKGAAYAAKYVSKNIDGKGLEGDIDPEGQKKISSSVKRVDAWASRWSIRQFQFFGCPAISGWRVLRRMRGPVAVVGSMLERARSAADDSDFAGYWRAALAGGLSLIYRFSDRLTAYGDEAAARIVGIAEGARRAMLPEKVWRIQWAGASSAGGFGVPRSCVNNCTGHDFAALAVANL